MNLRSLTDKLELAIGDKGKFQLEMRASASGKVLEFLEAETSPCVGNLVSFGEIGEEDATVEN